MGQNEKGRRPAGDGRSSSRSGSAHRSGDARRRDEPQPKARRDLRGAARELPRWVVEDLTRVTPKDRTPAALEALGEAAAAMTDGRFHVAVKQAQKAKKLAPRDATVRETLALASYRVGDWRTALSELRTYRRLSGETTHLPVEMDALRALGRPEAIRNAWDELRKRKGAPAVMKEGLVVYASHLIDQDEAEEAFRLTDPKGVSGKVHPQDLRVWYTAARAAAVTGRTERASELRNQILERDPAFPGIDDLESIIRRSGR